jgi:hypothetical protein
MTVQAIQNLHRIVGEEAAEVCTKMLGITNLSSKKFILNLLICCVGKSQVAMVLVKCSSSNK